MSDGRDLVRLRTPVPVVVGRARGELRRLVAGRGELLAYLVVGLAVVVPVVVADWGWFTPDTRPELYQAPGRALRAALSVWRSDPSLGQPNFDTGTAPMALVLVAIRALGASPWLAERVWRALLLVVAGAGAVLLYHWIAVRNEATGPRHTAAGRVAAGLVYAANPYVVVAGATTPVLLPYALLPWLLLALGRALREPRSWLWPAAFALGFFAAGAANAGVVSLFMLLAVPCYLVWERLVRRVRTPDLLRVAGRCLGLALLVSLYWIVPVLAARDTGQAIAFATERPRDVAVASSYAETLRLLGLWTLYGRQGGRRGARLSREGAGAGRDPARSGDPGHGRIVSHQRAVAVRAAARARVPACAGRDRLPDHQQGRGPGRAWAELAGRPGGGRGRRLAGRPPGPHGLARARRCARGACAGGRHAAGLDRRVRPAALPDPRLLAAGGRRPQRGPEFVSGPVRARRGPGRLPLGLARSRRRRRIAAHPSVGDSLHRAQRL